MSKFYMTPEQVSAKREARLVPYLTDLYRNAHWDRQSNTIVVFVVCADMRQAFPMLNNVSEIHYTTGGGMTQWATPRVAFFPPYANS